ncbi:MAG TPA: T9SS type A sorting domain-containing protein, partial [Bacteroidia bacterium]|nr:T9SS type A sorting domain-containing protein [Bacteroidia bacterium]
NYGQTYDVRVRAKTGGIWGTYANTCTISLSAAAPSPQLQASYCNIGGLALNSYIYCTAVGGATDYRYQFTDFTDATVYTRTRGNYYTDFNLAWVTSPGRLKYNHTYNVEVAAKINGVWGAYGAVCQITTQGFPTPQLTPASCGASGLLSTDKIFTTSVGGATNYQYRFTAQGGGTPFTKFRGSNSTYYVLSWAGLAASTTYDVEVRAYAGGEWGPYGTTCTISTSQGFRFADPMAESQDGTEATKFSASVYPNPAEAGSTPYIQINGADGQKAVVRIFDIAGKECAAYTMQPVGEEFNAQMNSFAELQSGLYIITVTVNGSVQTSRLVIR